MRSLFAGAVLFAAVPATVWSQAPAGIEFRANSYTTSYQRTARVAVDANGGFVIVWECLLQDGASYGVFGQQRCVRPALRCDGDTAGRRVPHQ